MLKMSDVLGHDLVQSFPRALNASTSIHSSIDLDDLINQAILMVPIAQLHQAVSAFFKQHNAIELAQALDISNASLQAIQAGHVHKEQLEDTAKIVGLCLALETEMLEQVEISDCIKDYPI